MPRYDLHIQAMTREEQLEQRSIFTLGYADSLAVRGFQLLINIWMKVLFTRRGSDPTNLERGTAYVNLIGSNTTLDEAEDLLRISIDQCNEQVRAIQAGDTTLLPRERLLEAKLVRYTADPSGPGFDAYVEILNQAGERLQVNIPAFARST
jgi:hypothetical protein